MGTRPRAPTQRPKKSSAPPVFGGDALNDEGLNDEGQNLDGTRNEPPLLTDEVGVGEERGAEITRSTLRQRDFGLSVSREERIAIEAYWRAERRGFEPGHELDDWLDAERTVDDDEGSAPGTG